MTPEAHAAIRRGQEHFFAEPPQLDLAIRDFRLATELAPEWSEGFHWLAATLKRIGEPQGALVAATRAVELSNDDERHIISLGSILLDLHRLDEAATYLRRGVELRPAEEDARLFLADALDQAGRRDEAREQWEIVSSMEPSYPSYDRAIGGWTTP